MPIKKIKQFISMIWKRFQVIGKMFFVVEIKRILSGYSYNFTVAREGRELS